MLKLEQYIKNMSTKVKGKERDSVTAKNLRQLAKQYYEKQEPLTIQQAGKDMKIKFPNYLHQVIKRNGDKVKKVKVNGRSLIIPSDVA